MKKICVCTSTYPIGGSYGGVFIKDQCKMLQSAGFDVCVLFANPQCDFSILNNDRKTSLIYQDDIKVYISNYFSYASTYTFRVLKSGIIDSFDLLYHRYIQENGKPDLFICNFSFPTGIGVLELSKKYQIPYVVVEHSSLLLNPRKKPWLNSTLSKIFLNSARVICVSRELSVGIKKRIPLNIDIDIIPNTIDSIFNYKERVEKNEFVFLSVGSLRKIKNHDLLIKSFALAFKNENVSLTIVGDGPQKKALETLITKLGMESQIYLTGSLNRFELLEKYIKCDCFVLLSKKETFGIAFREAMAVGRPVVSSNNGGILYGWDEKFGIITDSTDIKCISEVLKLIRNSYSFDLQYISENSCRLFSQESIKEQYSDIINSLLI